MKMLGRKARSAQPFSYKRRAKSRFSGGVLLDCFATGSNASIGHRQLERHAFQNGYAGDRDGIMVNTTMQ